MIDPLIQVILEEDPAFIKYQLAECELLKLDLRRPDGTSTQTTLVTYGVSVLRGNDGAFYLHDDPADAEIRLTIPGDPEAELVPVGTEVWLL